MRENKRNNKGFSLVELIVVIAIMIVLVAILAPVFTKYVERSRRATDVQNANSIAESVLIDAADGELSDDAMGGTATKVTAGTPKAIKSDPVTSGNAVNKGKAFMFEYNKDANTVKVYVEGDTSKTDLTTEAGAKAYRDDETGDNSTVDTAAP